MNTTFWGPSGWEFLHTLTFIYPFKPSYNDKVKMQNFMASIGYILPCKYCRDSFNKYIKTLPIVDYLNNRENLIEWLYKIHNKVNKKLRSQGLCNHKNPDFDNIKYIYQPIINKIKKLCNSNSNSNSNSKQTIINYICNLGKEFLGSIVFNYQSYYTNCHSGNEKIKIVSVYHSFFNSIIPLICSYLEKYSIHCNDKVITYTIISNKSNNKHNNYHNNNIFKIRSILTHTEAYTKLIEWFYKCEALCNFSKEFNTLEDYINYYKKHIVLSCNNPLTLKGKKIKSCRKTIPTKRRQTKRTKKL